MASGATPALLSPAAGQLQTVRKGQVPPGKAARQVRTGGLRGRNTRPEPTAETLALLGLLYPVYSN